MSTAIRPPKSPPNVVHETRPGDYIAVAIGRGIIVWHTHEEWERFLKGVDVEAALILGKPSGGGKRG